MLSVKFEVQQVFANVIDADRGEWGGQKRRNLKQLILREQFVWYPTD